jgi:hypothetical protein
MRTPAPVLFILIVLTLFAGCNLNTDYFSDYRGKNILGNSDFGTGKWSLASDTVTQTTATSAGKSYSPTNYMTWEAVGSGANDGSLSSAYTRGPDGVSPGYRLELKNLIADGDFESDAVGTNVTPPANWTMSGGGGRTDIVLGSLSGYPNNPNISLDNRALVWNQIAGGNYLNLEIDTAFNANLLIPGGYLVRFDFVNLSLSKVMDIRLYSTSFSESATLIGLAGAWSLSGLTTVLVPTRYGFSQIMTLNSSNLSPQILQFGTISSTDFFAIDNVRVVKTDLVSPSVALNFSSLSSGSLQLLPGTKSGAYTLSFYVRDDPTADSTNGVHLLNRLEPSGISASIIAAQKPGSSSIPPIFAARPSGGWTSWTLVSIPLGIDFVDNDGQLSGRYALTVQLSPTNILDLTTGGEDVGSLLVSEPTLKFNP